MARPTKRVDWDPVVTTIEYFSNDDVREILTKLAEANVPLKRGVLIERDQNKERDIWEHHIQPIIDKYDLQDKDNNKFGYCFFPNPTKLIGDEVHEMQQKAISLYLKKLPTRFQKEFPSNNFLHEILKRLRRGEKKIVVSEDVKIDLVVLFVSFLEKVFSDRTLPQFLEALKQNGKPLRVASMLNDAAVWYESIENLVNAPKPREIKVALEEFKKKAGALRRCMEELDHQTKHFHLLSGLDDGIELFEQAWRTIGLLEYRAGAALEGVPDGDPGNKEDEALNYFLSSLNTIFEEIVGDTSTKKAKTQFINFSYECLVKIAQTPQSRDTLRQRIHSLFSKKKPS